MTGMNRWNDAEPFGAACGSGALEGKVYLCGMAHRTTFDTLQVLELVGTDAPPDQSHQLALNCCQIVGPIADLAHPAMLLNISSALFNRLAVWSVLWHFQGNLRQPPMPVRDQLLTSCAYTGSPHVQLSLHGS